MSLHQQTISFLSGVLSRFLSLKLDNIDKFNINYIDEEECVNTLFAQKVLVKLSHNNSKKKLLKNIYQLATRFTLLSLFSISSFVFAGDSETNANNTNKVSRSDVAPVSVNLGEKIAFRSNYLNEHREFYVRLPTGYQASKRDYPVIYLLDANNETLTYMENLYFHSVTQIERLMGHNDIPESIIVGVPFKSSQWYSNVVGNPDPFQNYLTKELSTYIDDHYRTIGNNVLIGQSYSAVFVINALPKASDTFNSFIAIEPVLASGQLDIAIANYQNVKVDNSDLQIIMAGDTLLHEATELKNNIASKNITGINVSMDTFPLESHGSVYYPALNNSLRKYFQDYRQPDQAQILSSNFGHQELLNYLDKRATKYQVETTDKVFQAALFDMIFYHLMAKNFEQAFTLWPQWQSRNKVYNANRVISHFLRNNDTSSAISLLHHMTQAMPTSVSSFDRLATLYQQDKQTQQAKKYHSKVQTLLNDIFSKPLSRQQEASLNSHGYNLLSQQRNHQALALFKRITLANPNSINAFDSLADAYEATKNYPKAITSQERTISLAKGKEGVSTATFEQKLTRLQNKNNHNKAE